MRAILGLFLALLAWGAQAQLVAPARDSSFASVSGGTVGRLTDDYLDGIQSSPGNYIWRDTSSEWIAGAVPDSLRGAHLIHTDQADAATAGSSTVVSFTPVGDSTVLVIHDDAETAKPAWLTADFLDCGLDVVDDTGTYSVWGYNAPGAVTLGGNCAAAGCQASPNMYLVAIVPAWRAICQPQGPSSVGSLQFTQAAYSGNELTDLTFRIERVGGSSGVLSGTVAEGANPGNGVLNTTAFTFADGDAATQSGTVSLADVGPGDETMTLTLSGSSLGSPTTATLTIRDLDSPALAADLFVNRTDPGCDDVSNNGTEQTDMGGGNGPFCTIARGNQAPAGSTIGVVSSTYTADPIIPGAANLTYIPIGGDVTLVGPVSGSINRIVDCDQPGLQILRDSGNQWLYNGGVVWGTGAGEVEQGENPSTVARITQGGGLGANCDNAKIQMTGAATAGWNGWLVNAGTTNLTFQVQFPSGTHGAPAFGAGDDFGDWFWTNADYPNTLWMDGCEFSDGLTYQQGGHSIAHLHDSKILAGCTIWDNRWYDVPTWGTPYGNRAFSATRSLRGALYDLVINGGGYSPDNNSVSCAKLEGQGVTIAVAVIRNCYEWGHNIASAEWSNHAYGGRVYHVIYQNLGSYVANIRQYEGVTGDGRQGPNSQLEDYRFKNIVVLGFDQDGGGDDLFNLVDRDGGCYEAQNDDVCNETITNTWRDFFELHGALIENATGDCADVYITASGDGRQNIPYYVANYPALFSNITCTTNAGYGNAPASGTRTTMANFATHWTPTSTTLTAGQGSDLTQASGPGTNSTNLCVDDIYGFLDPDGRSISTAAGQIGSFGAWMVNLDGTNVAYTNLATNGTFPNVSGCFTLVTPTDWPDNAPVNYPISSGSSPNLGAIL